MRSLSLTFVPLRRLF